jgi:hypothetical protein
MDRVRSLLKTGLVLSIAVLATAAGSAFAASHKATRHARRATARAAIGSLNVSGATVTVKGKVRLSPDTAATRKLVRVVIILTDAADQREQHTVKLGSGLGYKASWTTTFTGTIKLTVRAKISGKPSGNVRIRKFTIAQQVTTPVGGTPLVGTFKLTAGNDPAGGQPTGSYFEMLQSGGAPLGNLSSPGGNKDYTPFTPGTDGGLETFAYQGAPNPAFSGGSSGNALADRIIQPVPFYVINFSVETSSTDAQLGEHDPLPEIYVKNGQLDGQITAWDAQWNGQSFNQGTPKPDGSVPPPTTALTGTYDQSTKAFTLQWKSLIVGGPFNGFTGYWHLAGTFVPEPGTTGTGLPISLP